MKAAPPYTPITVIGFPHRPFYLGGKLDLLVRDSNGGRHFFRVTGKLVKNDCIVSVFAERRLHPAMDKHNKTCLRCESLWRTSHRSGRAWYEIEPIRLEPWAPPCECEPCLKEVRKGKSFISKPGHRPYWCLARDMKQAKWGQYKLKIGWWVAHRLYWLYRWFYQRMSRLEVK